SPSCLARARGQCLGMGVLTGARLSGRSDRSEGGLVVAGGVAPATAGLATALGCLLAAEAAALAALGTAGRPRVALLAAEAAALGLAAPAAALASTTAALGLGDLRGGVAQGRCDLVGLHLHDGALLTGLLVLPGPGDEAAGHDDARPTHERLGRVLRGLTPHGAAHEERLRVLPLVVLPVEVPRGRGHREVRDGRAGRGEPQLGVGSEVADDGD